MKKVGYILLVVSIMMIIAGGVSSFVLNIQEDKNITLRRMNDVADLYEEFSTVTSLFEDNRENLYTNTLGNIYFETMLQNDLIVKNSLTNYESMVDEINKMVKRFDYYCKDVYYPESSINNKCINYKSIYEQVNNYFVSDILLYNNNVLKFNNYQKSIGSTVLIEEYKTKRKFIDYNNDKNFDGKEEVNETK